MGFVTAPGLGGRPDLTSNQDMFAEPQLLEFDDGALVYRWENQAVASWGIIRSDLDSGQPDPPTRMCFHDETVWHPWMPSFSAACMEMVLWEWMLGQGVGLTDNDCREWVWVQARDEEALDSVRQALPVDWLM